MGSARARPMDRGNADATFVLMSDMGSFFSTPKVISRQPHVHVFEAVEDGRVATLKRYKQQIPDFMHLTKHGKTLLHCAVMHRQLECVKFLIDSGIDVNTRDKFMNTPLLEITQCKSKNTSELHDLIEFLIHSKANINATNSLKRTALLKSIILFRHNISEILLQFGADPNICDTDGLLPIHVCTTYSALPLLRSVLKHKASINAQDVKGRTALYFAILSGHQSIAEELINQGCDVNRGSSFGFPLQTAIIKCKVDAVQLLLQHGADVHREVIDQRSTFFKANNCFTLSLIVVNLELSALPNLSDVTCHMIDPSLVERLWKAILIMELATQAFGKAITPYQQDSNRNFLRKFEKLMQMKHIPDLSLRKKLHHVHTKFTFVNSISKTYEVIPTGSTVNGTPACCPRSLENICRKQVRYLIGQGRTNVVHAVPSLDCSIVLQDLLLLKDV